MNTNPREVAEEYAAASEGYDVSAVTHALLYVGDQLKRLADAAESTGQAVVPKSTAQAPVEKQARLAYPASQYKKIARTGGWRNPSGRTYGPLTAQARAIVEERIRLGLPT